MNFNLLLGFNYLTGVKPLLVYVFGENGHSTSLWGASPHTYVCYIKQEHEGTNFTPYRCIDSISDCLIKEEMYFPSSHIIIHDSQARALILICFLH